MPNSNFRVSIKRNSKGKVSNIEVSTLCPAREVRYSQKGIFLTMTELELADIAMRAINQELEKRGFEFC